MKVSGRAIDEYIKAPHKSLTIIYGNDVNKTRSNLQKCFKAALGDVAAEEMRLYEFEYSEIKSDPAKFFDALNSPSFFPGLRGIVIYKATDASTPLILEALGSRNDNDSRIFVQMSSLNASSKARKTFDNHKEAMMIGLYEDAITPEKVRELVIEAKLPMSLDAIEYLVSISEGFDVDRLRKIIESLDIYRGDQPELSLEDVEIIAKGNDDEDVTAIIDALLSANLKKMITKIHQAPAKGISHHEILAQAQWKMKELMQVICADNQSIAMKSLRPPLFGKRLTNFQNQLQKWDRPRLEKASAILFEAVRNARSTTAKGLETSEVERAFIRMVYLAKR